VDAVEDEALGRAPLGERHPSRQARDVERPPLLVEQVERGHHLGHRRGEQRVGGAEPERPRGGVVGVDEAPVARLDGDPVGDVAEHDGEPLSRGLELVERTVPFRRGGDVRRDRQRQADLALAPGPGLAAVEHELAEEPAAVHERHEGERANPLGDDPVAEGREVDVVLDVRDEHRGGVDGAGGPGRMAGGEGAVPVGEAAPRPELHHAVLVREQDGGAVEAERVEERREGLLERVLEGRRVPDRVGEAVQDLEVDEARAQVLRGGIRNGHGSVERHASTPGVDGDVQSLPEVRRKENGAILPSLALVGTARASCV
jgi:hypothetical protein